MYLIFIKKTTGYEKFKMEEIPVKVIMEENRIKEISSNKEILVNDVIFEELKEFLQGKEITAKEVIKVEKMFYASFVKCPENSDDLFHVGRKLKEIMENEAKRQIQDLKELVQSIEDSRGRFA